MDRRRFADRTNPVTVRAETSGGVIFDGGGAACFGGISFEDGAHDQTWDGFIWQNGTPAATARVVARVSSCSAATRASPRPPHHLAQLHRQAQPRGIHRWSRRVFQLGSIARSA